MAQRAAAKTSTWCIASLVLCLGALACDGSMPQEAYPSDGGVEEDDLYGKAAARLRVVSEPRVGAAVAVEYSGLPGNRRDWLAVYNDANAADDDYQGWKYTGGARAGTIRLEGVDRPGRYQIRAFANDGYQKLGTVTFVVPKPGVDPGDDDPGDGDDPPGADDCAGGGIVLDLRVHLMRDVTMTVQGVAMTTNHITKADVHNTIVPGMNEAWAAANIRFRVESVVEEPVVKQSSYAQDIKIVETAGRDSDSSRTKALARMMRPANKDSALFHIYLFPFVGNTYQGFAYQGGYAVVAAWSNKHNGGGRPERLPLRGFSSPGSVARTSGHEQGHVLGLQHNESSVCNQGCLMKGSRGSLLTSSEIQLARSRALPRSACR
jgi:hypothetical protein